MVVLSLQQGLALHIFVSICINHSDVKYRMMIAISTCQNIYL